jgi:hypothetical protein
MAFEKVSDQVGQLIQHNEQRAAADLLMQSFRGKNQKLFNIAMGQLSAIKALADQSTAGMLSFDEIARNNAKINASLLQLSNEYSRLYEGAAPLDDDAADPVEDKRLPRWALLSAAAVLSILVIVLLLKYTGGSAHVPDVFDLEVRLYESGGEQKVIQEGQVNLRLGEEIPRPVQSLNAEGMAIFRELSGRYRDSVVHLLYFPARKDRHFKIKKQNTTTIKGETRQTVRFALEFLPDTTIFEAGLRDSKGRPISGAQITVDGTLHASSDERGYFKVVVPKASGAAAYLLIEKMGKPLMKQDITLSSGYREILIE